MPDEPDDDELDGCDLDFESEADDDETAELRPLFPDGEPSDKWVGVFPDAS